MPQGPDINLPIYLNLSFYLNLLVYIHISVDYNVTIYYYPNRSNHNSLYGYFHQNKNY